MRGGLGEHVERGDPWAGHWNATRTLGVGVKDMVATTLGLFVGSDTDVLGGETHRRVAFLPLAGGATLAAQPAPSLPGVVYRVPSSGQSQLLRLGFDGNQVTSSANGPNGTGWGSAVGAFMINGSLYTAYTDGTFTRRSFNGTTYGSAVPVNTADLLAFQTDWHNTDVPTLTSLFYYNGKIFYTRSNSSLLFNRAFEPESGVVGQQRFSTASVNGVSYTSMRGAFIANGQLYFATSNGSLNRANWSGNGAVSGTASGIPSAGGGWSSRALFLYQGP